MIHLGHCSGGHHLDDSSDPMEWGELRPWTVGAARATHRGFRRDDGQVRLGRVRARHGALLPVRAVRTGCSRAGQRSVQGATDPYR